MSDAPPREDWRDAVLPVRSAYAFPIYACEKCWHGESALSMHNKVIEACPKCGGTMREVGIPVTDAPQPCNLLCLVCAHSRPWGIWDSLSGVAVCIECRDKARRPAAGWCTVTTSDVPRPALGELARRATETIAARKAFDAVRFPTDFNSREGEVYEATRLAYRDALREWEAAVSDSANGPELVLQLVALATGGGDTARLLTDACEMADGRGWAMEWPDRYANLVLEASEFTEAWRGKHGDPVKEAGDVLLTYLLALGAAGVSWADAFAACSAKVAEFRTRAPYHGEFTAAHRAALTPERPADAD